MGTFLSRPSEPVYWEDKQKRERHTDEFECEKGAPAYAKAITPDIVDDVISSPKHGALDIVCLLANLDMCRAFIQAGGGIAIQVMTLQYIGGAGWFGFQVLLDSGHRDTKSVLK
jgi:hypothetical protein